MRQRDEIAMSDSIELRCGHRHQIAIFWELIHNGRKWRMMPVVECADCAATWIWGVR